MCLNKVGRHENLNLVVTIEFALKCFVNTISIYCVVPEDRLCGLVVRVPGYRSRGPGFDSRRYQIFWEVLGLERGSLSLVSITEELLEWKINGSDLENRD
jgi:hypothetical protein